MAVVATDPALQVADGSKAEATEGPNHPWLGRLIGATQGDLHPSAATSIEEATHCATRTRHCLLLFTFAFALAFGRGGTPSDSSSSSFTLFALRFFARRFGARFTSAFGPNKVRRKLLSSLILVTRDGLEATELFREREGVADTPHKDPVSASLPQLEPLAGPHRSTPLGQKVLLELHVQDLDSQEL